MSRETRLDRALRAALAALDGEDEQGRERAAEEALSAEELEAAKVCSMSAAEYLEHKRPDAREWSESDLRSLDGMDAEERAEWREATHGSQQVALVEKVRQQLANGDN